MRAIILASAAALSLAFAAAAETSPSFSQRPTEDYLRQLDNEQLRIVRRAVQGCPSVNTGRAVMKSERDPCVRSATDKAVADSGNEDLQAFHDGLRDSDSDRYDENRTSAAWMNWLVGN